MEPWRTARFRPALAPARPASIRPRRWSRGELVRLGNSWGAQIKASIRPRRWSRGERQRPHDHHDWPARFNSATALEPWRTLQYEPRLSECEPASIRPRRWSRGERLPVWRLGPSSRSSFNSATALEPWRTIATWNEAPLAWPASIRPRRWSRGEHSCSRSGCAG